MNEDSVGHDDHSAENGNLRALVVVEIQPSKVIKQIYVILLYYTNIVLLCMIFKYTKGFRRTLIFYTKIESDLTNFTQQTLCDKWEDLILSSYRDRRLVSYKGGPYTIY